MKKHLIAAAVAAAVVVPATAQVTVYGNLDTSVARLNEGTVSRSYVETSIFTTSVIGLKGSEDLGGGLKASFDLQGSLFSDDGGSGAAGVTRTGTTTTAEGSTLFNRTSMLAIDGGFGRVAIGRFADVTDAWHNTASQGLNLFDLVPSSVAGGKNPNTVGYVSPRFMGLQVRIERSLGSSTEVATASATKQTVHNSYGVEYVNGPLVVRLATASEKEATCTVGGTSTAGGCKDSNSVIAGSYNLGMATVAASMMKNGSKTITTGANNINNDSTTAVSVSVPQGQLTYSLTWQSVDQKAGTNGTTTFTDADDAKLLGVAVRYDLSKRTRVNAGATRLTNQENAKYGRASAAGKDVTLSAVGISHSF